MNAQKMKAVVCTQYGSPDFLQLREVAVPSPQEDEVLVRVHASTVTAADTMMRRAIPFISRFFLGFFRPKKAITGTGFAGEIVQVGRSVKRFRVGDQVFGETGVNFGANAEYVALSEQGVLARKPAGMSYEEAATLCDGPLTSLNFLKNLAGIGKGRKVLINGASGSLGTAAIQIAKHYGAEVTGVCSSRNVDLVKSLGADKVIDYTTTRLTDSQERYDLVFDTIGKLRFSRVKSLLTTHGLYLSPVLRLGLLVQVLKTAKAKGKKAKFSATGLLPQPELQKLLEELLAMIEDGALRPVLDTRFSLAQAPEAHRYVDQGHKKGNVVVVTV